MLKCQNCSTQVITLKKNTNNIKFTTTEERQREKEYDGLSRAFRYLWTNGIIWRIGKFNRSINHQDIAIDIGCHIVVLKCHPTKHKHRISRIRLMYQNTLLFNRDIRGYIVENKRLMQQILFLSYRDYTLFFL